MLDAVPLMNSLTNSPDRPAPPAAPLLTIERLHKRFTVAGGKQLHAVDDLNLGLMAGESIGLVGESGCGKSTLVRLIARLLDPSEGRIVFDGVDLAAVPARRFAQAAQRSAIQMVFQDPTDSLNPRFTARDTIAEPCRLLAGLDATAADTRVDEVAAQVGLLGQRQPGDDLAADQVLVDDLDDVRLGDVAVPHLLRVDDDRDAVRALIEAARVVGADHLRQPARRELDLEPVADRLAAPALAAALGVVGGPLVDAHEHVALKARHPRAG